MNKNIAIGLVVGALVGLGLWAIIRDDSPPSPPDTVSTPRPRPTVRKAVGSAAGIGSDQPWSLAQNPTLGPYPQGTAGGQNSLGGTWLAGAMGYRVSVQAQPGCTLTGGGSVLAWVYSNALGAWGRDPGLDFSMAVSSTSCTNDAGAGGCIVETFPDVEPGNPGGRVFYQASAITQTCTGVDAGAPTVTVALDLRVN